MSSTFAADPNALIKSISINQESNILSIVTQDNFSIWEIKPKSLTKIHTSKAKNIRSVHPLYSTQVVAIVGHGARKKKTPLHDQSSNANDKTVKNKIQGEKHGPSTTSASSVTSTQRQTISNNKDRVYAYDNHTVALRSLESGEDLAMIETEGEIINLMLRPDYLFVVSVSQIYQIDLGSFTQVRAFPTHQAHYLAHGWDSISNNPKSYSPDSRPSNGIVAVSYELNKSIEETFNALNNSDDTEGFSSNLTNGAHSPFVLSYVTPHEEKSISVVSSRRIDHDASPTCVKDAHSNPLTCLAVSFDGSLIASASTLGTLVRVRSSRDPNNVKMTFRRGTTGATIHTMAFSRDNKFLAAASDSGTVHIWNLHDTEKNSRGLSYYLLQYPKAFCWHNNEPKCPSVMGFTEKPKSKEPLLHIAYLNGRFITLTFSVTESGPCSIVQEVNLNPLSL